MSFFNPPTVPSPLVSKNIFNPTLPAFTTPQISEAPKKDVPKKAPPTLKTSKSQTKLGTPNSGTPQDSPATLRKNVPAHLQGDVLGVTPDVSPMSTPRLSSRSMPVIKQKAPEEIKSLYEKFLSENPKIKTFFEEEFIIQQKEMIQNILLQS